MDSFDAVIIGGGPAGSASALYLRRLGLNICLIEKAVFPRETVCGEFLSAEAARALKELGLFERFLLCSPSVIDTLKVHTPDSRAIESPLEFTAYGIKRGRFDLFLLHEAARSGVTIMQPAEVTGVHPAASGHTVIIARGGSHCTVHADAVIAAYGKRNILDKTFARLHAGADNTAAGQRAGTDKQSRQSGLNGIKFHISRDYYAEEDAHTIHIFASGNLYCGVNPVDERMVTVCFLEKRGAGGEAARARLKRLYVEHKGFHDLFTEDFESACLRARVYGIGDIYFGRKDVVHDGIFMAGDAAGAIAPLAGDGMGMAFESARLLADAFWKKRSGMLDRRSAESSYARAWRSAFRRRLWAARSIQAVLLAAPLRNAGLNLLANIPRLLPMLVRLTRGSE